jgi:hypothetical protein
MPLELLRIAHFLQIFGANHSAESLTGKSVTEVDVDVSLFCECSDRECPLSRLRWPVLGRRASPHRRRYMRGFAALAQLSFVSGEALRRSHATDNKVEETANNDCRLKGAMSESIGDRLFHEMLRLGNVLKRPGYLWACARSRVRSSPRGTGRTDNDSLGLRPFHPPPSPLRHRGPCRVRISFDDSGISVVPLRSTTERGGGVKERRGMVARCRLISVTPSGVEKCHRLLEVVAFGLTVAEGGPFASPSCKCARSRGLC